MRTLFALILLSAYLVAVKYTDKTDDYVNFREHEEGRK